jgi:hypothetical protein
VRRDGSTPGEEENGGRVRQERRGLGGREKERRAEGRGGGRREVESRVEGAEY